MTLYQVANTGRFGVRKIVQIASMLFLCTIAFSAYPAVISLFNTGVDSGGSVLGGSSLDPHWKLITAPGISVPADAVVVSDQSQSGQYFQSADSGWIWANATGAAAVGQLYTFALEFDLTGYDPNSAEIAGSWSVDNIGTMLLNGQAPIGTGTFNLPSVITSNHNSAHSFTITDGFISGINRIDIQVFDDRNPGGLNVFGLVGTALPVSGPVPVSEPSILVIFGAGFLGLIGIAVRRRERT